MKNYFILTIVFLLTTCCCYGQEADVYKYYKFVNKAELARDLRKNKKASKYYEKAFKYNRPFSKDLFQYLWLYSNFHYGNESNALQYATYNAQREMLWTHLLKKDSVFHQKITIIKDTTRSTVIPSLRAALDSLLQVDQQVHSSDTSSMNQIVTTDSLNMQKLASLFETYGYINEDNAGEKACLVISLIFIHYSKTQTDDPPFHILEDAVRAGTFDAREYIYLYDFCWFFRNEIYHPSDTIKRNSRFGTDMNHYQTVGDMLFIYPPENVKKVNANRKSILMAETWKDYEKKLINTFLAGGYGFVQLTPIGFGSKEEEEEKRNELMQEIDSGKVKGKYLKGERFVFP